MIAQKTTGTGYNVLLGAVGKHVNVPVYNTIHHVQLDSAKHIVAEQQKVYKGMIPDVKGMGLKDALYLLEQEGLFVHIKGKGRVRAQSVAPGTIAQRGQEIILELGS